MPGTAVFAIDQPGEHILLSQLGRPPLALPHPLNDFPGVQVNQWLVGFFKAEYLVRRVQKALFVLKGWSISPAVDGIADILLMLQNTGHCAPRPGIGPVRIQSGVADTSGAVGVGGWGEDLFLCEHSGDLVRSWPSRAQLKDTGHHGGGLFIRDQALGIPLVLFIAVGGRGPNAFSPPCRCHNDRFHLLAGVTGVPFVKQVTDGDTVVNAVDGVHAVVDGNIADMVLGKGFFQQDAHYQPVASQAGVVFNDDGGHPAGLHLGHHFQIGWTVE